MVNLEYSILWDILRIGVYTTYSMPTFEFDFSFAWWTQTTDSCLSCGNSRTNYGMCEFKHAQSILKLNLRENLKRRLLIFTTIYSLAQLRNTQKHTT